jgi:hypothetical protein
MTDSTTDLVQQGLTAARVGDAEDARRLLIEATQQMPDNIEAWLGLAGVVEALEEKRNCFGQVLALDPDNQEAQAGLALVEKKLADQRSAAHAHDEVQSDASAVEMAETDSGLTVCYRHPHIETGLRCNRCNKPICPQCAVRTPVGFRCPDCIREQENKYYSGGNVDYVIAAVIALPLSLIGAGLFTFILGRFGFWIIFIGLLVAPAVAGFIAEVVRWGVGRRRSRYLRHVVAGSLILGTLPFLLLMLLSGGFWGLLAPGMFAFLGTTTVLARLR